MNLSHFFIDRPIFAAVISIMITLIGGVAYFSLPIAHDIGRSVPTLHGAAPGFRLQSRLRFRIDG